MLVSDVDITIIYRMLQSVPSGMTIHSIDLTNGYELKLTAGTDEIKKVDYDVALSELQSILGEYNKPKSNRLKSR